MLRDEAPSAKAARVAESAKASPTSRYVTNVLQGFTPAAEAEHPLDKNTDEGGWTEVSDVYRAPSGATHATIELHLQWAPRGKISWSDISLAERDWCPPPAKCGWPLAHFRPTAGKTPAEKCRAFAPLIEDAARQRADLVVLPENPYLFRHRFELRGMR